MALKVYDTGIITCTTTTDNQVTDHIKGKILKLQITASASSDFKIWIDASDSRGLNQVDEYILGDASNAVTVNTTATYYPVVAQYLTAQGTPAVTDPDQFSLFIVDDRLEINATNVAANDTYRIVIWYDNMKGRDITS